MLLIAEYIFLIPYLALTLAGMARYYFYFLSTWTRKSTQFVVSGSILFLPPHTPEDKKNIWSELESNPGPRAAQATALTTVPLLHGLLQST